MTDVTSPATPGGLPGAASGAASPGPAAQAAQAVDRAAREPVGGPVGRAVDGPVGGAAQGAGAPGPGPVARLARRVPDRVLVLTAAVTAATAVVCCAAVAVVHPWLADRAPLGRQYVSDLVIAGVWPVLGALVVRGRPRNAVGWLLVLPAVMGPYLLLAHYAAASALVADHPLPGGTFAAWVAAWGFAPYWFCVPLLPMLFPDGRLPSPGWRPVAWTVVALAAVAAAAAMVAPAPLDISPRMRNPLGQEGQPWLRWVVIAGSFGTLLPGAVLGVVALMRRTRVAVGVQRAQLQLFQLGGLVLVVCLVTPVVAFGPGGAGGPIDDVMFSVGLLAPPVAITVAMLRHRMFDVEFVLNRTIVYVVLTALLAGLYAAIVLGVGHAAPGSPAGVLVVAVIALLAASGRGAVQAAVDRWLFGHRHDPYAVVARVGRHVAPAAEPAEALDRLVEALRTALRLPYVAFLPANGGPAVASGTPVAGWRVVPAQALGQAMGELHVGVRGKGARWSSAELAAIEEVAARAATLAYAAGLVEDVARSRARIVVAREEERRRLRADLHDGVGPVLAGTAHQADALARRLRAGPGPDDLPDLADRASAVRDRLRQTVTDLRSVVHGLRPPVLDQLGLAGALRGLVSAYETPACAVTLGPGLDDVPAAVEVAAYQIAAEAVHNAVRHSAAGELELSATLRAGVLVLRVRDNGCGIPPRARGGVGLRSMGERAAEVGGRLDILPAVGGGTIVQAELPGDLR